MAKNSMTEAATESEQRDLTFRRRDMLEAEKVAGVAFAKLFEGGEATALGALAVQYVIEKRNGVTDLDWDAWLDEEPDELAIEAAPDPS